MASPNALAADPIPGNPATVHFNYNGGNSGNVNNGKDSDATLKRKAKIGSFNKIEASQGIKIFFSQGKNTGHAEVLTTPSAKDYISVTVEGGCLNAHYKRGFKSIKGYQPLSTSLRPNFAKSISHRRQRSSWRPT